jgi:hypothetical protein
MSNRVVGRVMSSSNEYRAKAMEILLQAERASDDAIRSELLSIAASYARLVDRAERAGDYASPDAGNWPPRRSTQFAPICRETAWNRAA